VQFLLGFNVEEQNFGAERFFHLTLGLPDAAEDNVLPSESRLDRPKELTARHDVDSCTHLAEQRQNGDARVRLDAVVKARVKLSQRRLQLSVLGANRGAAVHVARSANCARDQIERDLLNHRRVFSSRVLLGHFRVVSPRSFSLRHLRNA